VAAPGWFTLAVSGLVEPSGTKQPYEVRPPSIFETGAVALHARRLRNLSVPTSRRFLADKLDPRRVTTFGRRAAEGIETLARSGQLPSAASAQLVHARSSGRIGGAIARRSRGWSFRSPAWGPIQTNGVGLVPQRSCDGIESQRWLRRRRSPVVLQLGRQLPTPGRRSHQGSVMCVFSFGGLRIAATHRHGRSSGRVGVSR
jgi:hypothetical protein